MSGGHGVDEATDEQLVARTRRGDERAVDALLRRHREMVRRSARGYFLLGADHEDLVQEGMIGLYRAVSEFEPGLGAGFRTFAGLCVERQILTAIKASARHKHAPLNDYVSLQRPVGEDGERTLAEVLPASRAADPAEQVLFAERVRDLRRHCEAVLSDLEAEVLRLHVDGRSYQDIARLLRRHAKAVDNALQRIRRKLDGHFAAWGAESA